MNELIANLAEKLGVTPKALIITVIFFVAAFAVLWIKMTLDEKKGKEKRPKEKRSPNKKRGQKGPPK